MNLSYEIVVGERRHVLTNGAVALLPLGIVPTDIKTRFAAAQAWHANAIVNYNRANRVAGESPSTREMSYSLKQAQASLRTFLYVYQPLADLIDELYGIPVPRDIKGLIHSAEIEHLAMSLCAKEQAILTAKKNLELLIKDIGSEEEAA